MMSHATRTTVPARPEPLLRLLNGSLVFHPLSRKAHLLADLVFRVHRLPLLRGRRPVSEPAPTGLPGRDERGCGPADGHPCTGAERISPAWRGGSRARQTTLAAVPAGRSSSTASRSNSRTPSLPIAERHREPARPSRGAHPCRPADGHSRIDPKWRCAKRSARSVFCNPCARTTWSTDGTSPTIDRGC
jgi:hypothetical protein